MDTVLERLFSDALFISRSLFTRNKTTGSTANMSFIHGDKIYITGTETCFGNLDKENFSILTKKGEYVSGAKPSKETKMHIIMYDYWKEVRAIIHTHSFYSTLWSCLHHDCSQDVVPNYTPYLKMKIGNISVIPYASPGSTDLFNLLQKNIYLSRGFLLQNHGAIIGGKNLLDSFYIIEELEESLKIAWYLKSHNKNCIKLINN